MSHIIKIFDIVYLVFMFGTPFLASLLYWCSSTTMFTWKRILVSIHGMLLYLSLGYALAAGTWTNYDNYYPWLWPLHLFLALFVGSVVYSLICFKGNRKVHLILILLLPIAYAYWFGGAMNIAHDWL